MRPSLDADRGDVANFSFRSSSWLAPSLRARLEVESYVESLGEACQGGCGEERDSSDDPDAGGSPRARHARAARLSNQLTDSLTY